MSEEIKIGRREFIKDATLLTAGLILPDFIAPASEAQFRDPLLVRALIEQESEGFSNDLFGKRLTEVAAQGNYVDFGLTEWQKRLDTEYPPEFNKWDKLFPENPRSQKSGDCAPNAAVSLLQANYVQLLGDMSWKRGIPTRTLNPGFIVGEREIKKGKGMAVWEVADALRKFGVCTDNLALPYDQILLDNLWQYQPTKAQIEEAKGYRIKNESWITWATYTDDRERQTKWKAYLVDVGPFYLSFTAFESISAPGGFICKPKPTDNPLGVHCMLVTGWSDSRGGFWVRNSWGPSWGENGNAYMAYDYFSVDVANTYSHVAADYEIIKPRSNQAFVPEINDQVQR